MRPATGAAAPGWAVALIAIAALVIPSLLPGRVSGDHALAGARPPKPFTIYAGAWVKPDKKAPPPPGVKTARSYLKGLTVTVEHADPARRAAFLRGIEPGTADPFAPNPGRPDRFVAFIVTLENAGPEPVVFNPGNIALVSNKGERAFPLDMTDMYMTAERQGVDDLQAVLDRSARILFDSSTTVPPGAGLSRLVVFRQVEGKWRQLQVHFSFLQIGRETHTLSFTFHKREEQG